jgi:hypothetical protein
LGRGNFAGCSIGLTTKHYRLYLIAIILILASLACDLTNPTPAAWALTPTALAIQASVTAFAATQAANFAPLPSLTPVPSPAPPTATVPATTLANDGPWLVYPTNGGQAIVARNVDGSAPTLIEIPPLMDGRDLTRGLSPNGGVIAFRTGLPSQPAETALYKLYLPSGHLERITPLFSESEQALVQAGNDPRARDAAAGVVRFDSLAWSPDGRYLAFIAALERNASDLYLYDTVSGKISRMTFGPNMYATPFWSTNSLSIITQEVVSFNTTSSKSSEAAAWTLGDVWMTDVKSGLSAKIYTPPPESAGEVFVGWENDTGLLTYSRTTAGGTSLRLVNLSPHKITTLLSGPFDGLAIDPDTKMVAFTRSQGGSGLYLLAPDSLDPRLVQAGAWQGLKWSVEGGEFMASGPQGVVSVTPGGTPSLISGEVQIAPAPGSNWLAGWGDSSLEAKTGLRLYRSGGALVQEVTGDPVQAVAWQPDAKGFFYISGSHLNLAAFPSLQPLTLDPDLKPGATPVLVWVRS